MAGEVQGEWRLPMDHRLVCVCVCVCLGCVWRCTYLCKRKQKENPVDENKYVHEIPLLKIKPRFGFISGYRQCLASFRTVFLTQASSACLLLLRALQTWEL